MYAHKHAHTHARTHTHTHTTHTHIHTHAYTHTHTHKHTQHTTSTTSCVRKDTLLKSTCSDALFSKNFTSFFICLFGDGVVFVCLFVCFGGFFLVMLVNICYTLPQELNPIIYRAVHLVTEFCFTLCHSLK